MKDLTQKEKVLKILIKYGTDGRWFNTYEFMQYQEIFIGHRGPARISDLARDYPGLIETDSNDKVYKYRFRFNSINSGLETVPPKVKKFILGLMHTENIKYKVFKSVPVFNEATNSVRFEMQEVVINQSGRGTALHI